MKDKTAVMCHNIAKYNRAHQEPEMTPLEAAERLKDLSAELAKQPETWKQMACLIAASCLRKIAAGEYAPVVHGHWITHIEPDLDWIKYRQECSECHESIKCASKPFYCENCGAQMDGDLHA